MAHHDIDVAISGAGMRPSLRAERASRGAPHSLLMDERSFRGNVVQQPADIAVPSLLNRLRANAALMLVGTARYSPCWMVGLCRVRRT